MRILVENPLRRVCIPPNPRIVFTTCHLCGSTAVLPEDWSTLTGGLNGWVILFIYSDRCRSLSMNYSVGRAG